MTTHVFIVDSTTFKLHLEYLFAGTGAKDNKVDFNNGQRTALHATTENMLIGMIADGSRIRRGDQIIFYLQQEFSKKIFEGKFFGIFKAKNDWSFLDNNDRQQFLKDELEKSLTFRTLIEPYKVYAEGVTEWEALDEIKNMTSPNQMLWSLIYRKLKGNRGNTMITIYEAERLTQLIRNKNNRTELNCENKVLSFDPVAQKIICLAERPRSYTGRQESINLLPRLIAKYQDGNSFESHLQAYITKNLGKGINTSLDEAILNSAQIEWLGNEVSCGVGMQRIDVMPSVVQNEQRILIPIELKAVEADERNIIQIQRYVDWIEQYYIPNRQSDIQPVLVAKKISDKQSNAYERLIDSFSRFNKTNKSRCAKLKYIEFDLDNGDLSFEIVAY
jgi:predicted RNA-binding protein